MEPETTGSRTLLTVVIVAILVLVVGLIWYRTGHKTTDVTDTNATSSTPTMNGTPSAQNDNIIIYEPQQNDRVGTPLVIQGQARTFENGPINFRLKDATGKEIAKDSATPNSPDAGQFGEFRGELNFVSATDQDGTLEIYTLSAKDGSEVDKLTIPVTITKTPEFIKG